MIAVLGDTHGLVIVLELALEKAYAAGATALIQVGDFGFCREVKHDLLCMAPPKIPVYVIDGNHEDYRWMAKELHVNGNGLALVGENVFYVPRGTVLELDGKRIAFLGGAGSIDYRYRTKGRDWFDEEQITWDEVERLNGQGKVDLMITHTPPGSVVEKYWGTPIKRLQAHQMFGCGMEWSDPSASKVEVAWCGLGRPPLICGHMHESLQDGNVRILNINELVFVE